MPTKLPASGIIMKSEKLLEDLNLGMQILEVQMEWDWESSTARIFDEYSEAYVTEEEQDSYTTSLAPYGLTLPELANLFES